MKRTSFKKLLGGMLGVTPPLWQPAEKPYPRLIGLDIASLAGREGIYAICTWVCGRNGCGLVRRQTLARRWRP